MHLRIVVADEHEADFFDAWSPAKPLSARGSVRNQAATLHDRDLETDRPGRRYGGTSGVTHAGAQAGHHHDVDGEKSTKRHDLALFTKEVARRIDRDRVTDQFERLVIIAPPRVLGMLRQSLPKQIEPLLAAEVAKDLMHQDEAAILRSVPREVFWDVSPTRH
jgi:protein required for attachment to host cells